MNGEVKTYIGIYILVYMEKKNYHQKVKIIDVLPSSGYTDTYSKIDSRNSYLLYSVEE